MRIRERKPFPVGHHSRSMGLRRESKPMIDHSLGNADRDLLDLIAVTILSTPSSSAGFASHRWNLSGRVLARKLKGKVSTKYASGACNGSREVKLEFLRPT